jgi:lysyl-tRNA synthetase class I
MLATETSTQINVRQALIQEIDQTSDYLLSEVLDFLLFIRAKHSPVQLEIQTDISELVEDYDTPKEKILEDLRQSLEDAKAGRVHGISELWDGGDK